MRVKKKRNLKMTTLSDQIAKLIDDEVDKRVQESLTRYAETIASVHRIPLSLLLRDLPSSRPGAGNCIGTTKVGSRCNKPGKYEGYCMSHYDQRKKVQPIQIIQEGPRHTHGVPPFFKDDCAACTSCPIIRKKLVIDCDVLF